MSTLTMVQIIDETIKFYGDDTTRRSFINGNYGVCAYNGSDNRHCAVGRCLTQEALDSRPDRFDDSNVSGVWYTDNALDRDLQPQYRGHTLAFWSALQQLHDENAHWDDHGLTETGMRRALGLMSKFMR